MQEKIKILYVSHFDHMKMGGQRSMAHLIENLDRERFEPMAITPRPGPLSEYLETLGCPSYYVPMYSLKPKFLHHAPPAIRKLRKIFKMTGADIVHPDFTADTFMCGLAKKGLKTKMVWHVRWNEHFSKDRLHGRLADAIIGVSDAAGSRFAKYPAIARKYRTIYNGVDCELFRPVDDKAALKKVLGIPVDKLTFIFVGVLKDGKGVVDIANAFGILSERLSKSEMPRLLFVGSRGKEETWNALQAIVRDKGLEDNVNFLPQQTNIHEWMQAADLLMIPSHEGNEGMPRVMYESMSCGTPVIGSDTTGINEALPPETGFLVPEQSPAAIAEVMQKVCASPAMLQDMRESCRAHALELFDIRKHARRVEQVYMEVLGQK